MGTIVEESRSHQHRLFANVIYDALCSLVLSSRLDNLCVGSYCKLELKMRYYKVMMLERRICTLVALLLLPVILCASYAQQHNGNGTNFSFSYFTQNNSHHFIYMGNASFSAARGYIDLTPDPNAITTAASSNQTAPNLALQNCIGRVLYRQQLTVWPASFTTTFTILVRNITTNATGGPTNFNGDGVAFIIVPDKKSFLPDSYGAFLGLFDSATDGNTTRQLAIEFDTFKNEFDPDNNHVGIDMNGIKSNATASMGEHGMDIKAGRPITVRVDYNGFTKSLQIYAGYADNASGSSSRSYRSLLNRTLELEKIVPRSVYVGFSASTGNSYGVHRILDWNFSSVTLPESSLKLSPGGHPGETRSGLKIGIVVGSITVSVALAGLASWFAFKTIRRRRQTAVSTGRGSFSGELAIIGNAPHLFPYKQLAAATKNFSEAELLGKGGFGSVYRGNLNLGGDEEGPWVAVKRISAGSRQGEREFISEITTIGRLRHRNLVQLQGWCHERDDLLLVYDYMPNGSLDKILFDSTGEPPLNWQRRHRILCGLASALLYLHEEWEQRVVHRDIKPSNVMLDREFNARLGDFGLARLIEHDDSSPALTTRLAGTPGYIAPECSYTGKATAESDVFSFGIVLLEVATGRRAVERKSPLAEGNLVDWVWRLYSEGRVVECRDPKLEGLEYDEEEIRRVLILGLACSHPDPHLRPSVRQALQVLINRNEELPALPSSRPLAIYVVLPSVGAVYSESSSNMGRSGASSSGMGDGSTASITYSSLHYGR